MAKRFPILNPGTGIAKSVPWELIEPFRRNALLFHDQSLELLAQRGGLSWPELFCVITGTPWNKAFPKEHNND